MNWRRPVTWLLVLTLISISGALVGSLLDWLFWQISYDYVYPRRQFIISATRVAGFLGSLTAATATIGSAAPAKVRLLTIMWIATLSAAAVIGILAGLLGYGLAKWVVTNAASGILAPRTRLWFCEGLRIGTLVGAAMSTCIWNIVLLQQRFKRLRNPQK